MNGLLTDLYELTMSAGYFEAGISHQTATFELFIRRLPERRSFAIAAGLPQVVEYLLGFRFTSEEIDYLRSLTQFARVSASFFQRLHDLRFTGDLFAVPEGTLLFAGEPVLTVRAPIMEAQIPETYLLAAIGFQTLIATKAARIAEAAGGRSVIEFGTRRAHTPEAGALAGRAAYIGGCIGTSNTLTGFRTGIPGLRHRRAFLGAGLPQRTGGPAEAARAPGARHRLPHRYVRYAGGRAHRRLAGPSAVGRPAG